MYELRLFYLITRETKDKHKTSRRSKKGSKDALPTKEVSKESNKKEKKGKKEIIAGAENADSSKQQRKSKSKRDAKVVKKGI